MYCYDESYDDKIKKQKLIKKGSYLLKSKCCNQNCNNLLQDIEKTANECHDIFRHMHKDNLSEEGKILSGSLCSDLEEKKNRILSGIELSSSNSKGGLCKKHMSVRKSKYRKTSKISRKTRKNKKRKN
jgi:hypothetical protein